MTSPSVDLDGIMPYGLNVSANTSTTYITPDGDSSRADGSFVLLPVGPCQVQFTWPGKQDAYVRWVDSANNEKGVPIEISGGGISPRPLSLVQLPATSCRSVLEPTPRQEPPELSRSTPRPDNHGGGLNGHTARNARWDFAVRDSLQDGHRLVHGARVWAARRRGVLHASRRCVSGAAGVYGAGGRRGVVEARRVRREDTQDVRYSGRFLRGAAQLQTANNPDRRGRAAGHYDHTPPERRRPVYIDRIAAHLPTTQIAAAGVVA